MQPLHARLKAACESDLGLTTPSSFPDRNDPNFPKLYFLYNLLRKEEPYTHKSEVPVDVLRSSLCKFADSEWRCRVINQHGRFYSPIVESDDLFFREAIRLAKSWISNTMMEHYPDWSCASYTSGASRNSSRSRSMSYLKQAGVVERGNMSGTAAARYIVESFIAPTFGHHWPSFKTDIVDDCRFDFVHKTASSVRFMAPQPELNMLAQKCVGDCIRDALFDATIDLNDQRWNQWMAWHGSVNRETATIDLSNSSDNVAIRHGSMLLPERIYDMCMATRTQYASVGAYKHQFQKLAPQGNGFIFEVQSLIYAGLCHAVTVLFGGREQDIAVYGDDIVISTNCAEPLMDLLVYLGMEPNLDKSYWGSDPFRESCGEHYYAGLDVTPFYVKQPLTKLRPKFRAINGLKYWETRTGYRLPSAIKLLVSEVDKKDRRVVPRSYSIDCGLHFAVSGCKFPKRHVTRYGNLVLKFDTLNDKVQDIAERLSDNVLYIDWFASPPVDMIDSEIWSKVCYPRNYAHGMPRVPKSYSRVLDVEKHPAQWVSVTANLADVDES